MENFYFEGKIKIRTMLRLFAICALGADIVRHALAMPLHRCNGQGREEKSKAPGTN
jgi:hypothetical protein